MKNIFLELKHYTTTDWDFACGECICHSLKRMAKPVANAPHSPKTLWPKFSLLSEPVFFIVISVQPDCQFIPKSAFAICHWPVNAFACGECGVFANSLKRIGKWHRANDRLGFADFNAKANGKSFSLFSLLSLSLFVIE